MNAFDSSKWTTILHFGNGYGYDTIYIGLETTLSIRSIICASRCSQDLCNSNIFLTNRWIFVSVVLKQAYLMIYYDGILIVTIGSYSPPNSKRSYNYIGKDNWGDIGNFKIDDLKIFNRALNLT